MNKYINMKKYGLTNHFEHIAAEYDKLMISRIIAQEKGLYRIITEQGEKLAEISGKFRYKALSLLDFPAVGDFVMADWNENGGNAVIHHVLPRVSYFVRKAAGNIIQEQIVAANVNTIFICMSLNNDFNLRRLERYLSIAWQSRAVPVIVLTKSDLCNNLDDKLSKVYLVANGVDVVITTTLEPVGYEHLRKFISEGKTVAFIGSSGVGKSTLINCLIKEKYLDVNGLRNDDKGRHTTTRRELIMLSDGGMVIDTPGMREIGMWDNDEGLSKAFEEIKEIASKCRFRDCTHSKEPGCAVKKALKNGELQLERWKSYQKLRLESSYLEDKRNYMMIKEKREKEISKLIKKLPQRANK